MRLTGASLLSLRGEYLLGEVLNAISDKVLNIADQVGTSRWQNLRRSLSDPNGSATVCPSTQVVRPRRVLGQIVEALKGREYQHEAVGLWIHKNGTVIRTHDHGGDRNQFVLFCNRRFLGFANPAFKAAEDQERAERRLLLTAVGIGSVSKDHKALLAEASSWNDSAKTWKRAEALIRDYLKAGNRAALLAVASEPDCPDGLLEQILRIERELRRQRGAGAVPSCPNINHLISRTALFATLNWSRWGHSELPGLAYFSKSSRLFAVEYMSGASGARANLGSISDSIEKELKRLGLKPVLPGAPIVFSVAVDDKGCLVGKVSDGRSVFLGIRRQAVGSSPQSTSAK